MTFEQRRREMILAAREGRRLHVEHRRWLSECRRRSDEHEREVERLLAYRAQVLLGSVQIKFGLMRA
jgi:hypothetical protein